MKNQELSQYPKSYLLCFLSQCSKRETCAHYVAGEHVRKDDIRGHAVFPTALRREGGCPFFQQLRSYTAAWGFDRLLEDVKHKDVAAIRKAIKEYLGGNGTYSRYKRGERLLSPEQQEWILNLMKRYGYTGQLQFDHYVEALDW